jgi:hypothetical protein
MADPTNKKPWIRNITGANKFVHQLKVQDGSTQAIKSGEICAWNKTAGYMVPISAVADGDLYGLAFAHMEQKSTDVERYMDFIVPLEYDVFEMDLDAARQVADGDAFILTISDSQTLTYSATGAAIFYAVNPSNIPNIADGVTLTSVSTVRVMIDPERSYYKYMQSGGSAPFLNVTAQQTLRVEQSGLYLTNTGAGDVSGHILPQSAPAGTTFTAFCTAAQNHGFAPGTAGGIYIKGAKQADNKQCTVDAIGDGIRVVADGNGDWIGEYITSGAATLVNTAIDVEG